MTKKDEDRDSEEIMNLDDAVKIIKRKIMGDIEPLNVEVKKLTDGLANAVKQADLETLRTQLAGVETKIEDLRNDILNIPEPIDVEALKANILNELSPRIKVETQATFREVLQRFGVKPATLDSGDMQAIIGELIPLLMPAVMNSGGLAALSKHAAPPETVDIKPRPELSEAAKKDLQTKCQTCGAPLRIKGSETSCQKCGAMNYAYRCYSCRDVFLTILAPDEIAGSQCPLCNVTVKSLRR